MTLAYQQEVEVVSHHQMETMEYSVQLILETLSLDQPSTVVLNGAISMATLASLLCQGRSMSEEV
jgi:hypothetical protein